jgi:hypothetical protein
VVNLIRETVKDLGVDEVMVTSLIYGHPSGGDPTSC